jgi:phage I-like protein
MSNTVSQVNKMPPPEFDEIAVSVLAIAREGADGGEVPTRILVAPWGTVRSSAGTFVVDAESAAATIAAFNEHGTDLPVDYEHQTLGGPYSSPTGQAPAAGWIKSLAAISPDEAIANGAEPGLWADVEWTPEALEKLRGRQYRYLSPVALVRRSDRSLIGLHSAALTNKPAIPGMKPVVASDAAALEATDIVSLRAMLDLDAEAPQDAVLVAAAQRIRMLEKAQSLREASERVARAFATGKLTTAQRPWAIALAERDPAEFDRWEQSAPSVVPLGRSASPDAASCVANSSRRAVEIAARAEWQTHRDVLENLCTEEAFVADAMRAAAH